MKKLLFNLIFFIAICYSLDFIIGNGLRKLYFKQESGAHYRTTHVLERMNADVVIMGSSRANHHYISDTIGAYLKKSVYNAGKDGSSIFYHYAMLKGLLKRYKPKAIILDVLEEELSFGQQWYDRLSELLPYYKHHPEIHDVISLKSPYEKIKLVSHIYPFNSSFLSIVAGNLNFNKQRHIESNGYFPLYGNYQNSNVRPKKSRYTNIDTNKIKVYKNFIQLCKLNDIKLFIVVSPYLISQDKSESFDLAYDIAKNNSIPFMEFYNHKDFINRREYFFDVNHLNNNGAIAFTKLIIDNVLINNLN